MSDIPTSIKHADESHQRMIAEFDNRHGITPLIGLEKRADNVQLLCMESIVSKPIRWLWRGWLARGKLHVLAGAPGTGKTTLALSIAAAITHGGLLPDGTQAQQGNVLVWSGEDDPADTLKPRLMAAGADVSHVYFVGDVGRGMNTRPFDPSRDLLALEHAAEKNGEISLLIADPVVSAVTGDSHKNTEVRRALQPMVNLATRLDCAVLGISHFSKGTAGRDPVERVTGSIAFGAIARVVMVTAKSDDGTRLLARAKSNIGPDGGGFAYTLEQIEHEGIEASRVVWGASLEGSARDLLGAAETDESDEGNAQEEASDWLSDELKHGPRSAKELKAEANKAGIAWRTVERAKAGLGIRSQKTITGWVWAMSSEVQCSQDRQHRQEIQQEKHGGLGGLEQEAADYLLAKNGQSGETL